MSTLFIVCSGLVVICSLAGGYCLTECDIVSGATQHVVAAEHRTVINSLNCSTTRAVYSFAVSIPLSQLEAEIICISNDTGEVHKYRDPSSKGNVRMGAVNFTSLHPALVNGSLHEGSKCQLYGCGLSSDDTLYYNIEGETCHVPAECIDSWGEWSGCYNEHCGIGWKNRTRSISPLWPICELDDSVEYKKCYTGSPCSSINHQDMQIIASSVALLSLLSLFLCFSIWIGTKHYISRHYRGMLHCINVNENEIFDAGSELVKVGTDSPVFTVTKHTSLSSLDLILPLGKLEDIDTDDFEETYGQSAPFIDSFNDEDTDNRSEDFCLQLWVKECTGSTNSAPIEENSAEESTEYTRSHMVTKHSSINPKTVLTSMNAEGYIQTQLCHFEP